MRVMLGVLSVLMSGAVAQAEECVDFSGRYFTADEEVLTTLTLSQDGCERVVAHYEITDGSANAEFTREVILDGQRRLIVDIDGFRIYESYVWGGPALIRIQSDTYTSGSDGVVKHDAGRGTLSLNADRNLVETYTSLDEQGNPGQETEILYARVEAAY